MEIVSASLLQGLSVARVDRRVVVVVGTAIEGVDAGSVLLAMGEADGVGAGEGNGFLSGETLGGEDREDLGDGHVRAGEITFDGEDMGGKGVFTAERDGVEGTTEHGDEIAGSEGENVGARDGVRASELELGLGTDDSVEGVAGEGEIDLGVAFGGVEGVGGDENGSVAAADEAVVEEEAERAGGGCGVGDLLVGDDGGDDGFDIGARSLVVARRQRARSPAGNGAGEEEEEEEG